VNKTRYAGICFIADDSGCVMYRHSKLVGTEAYGPVFTDEAELKGFLNWFHEVWMPGERTYDHREELIHLRDRYRSYTRCRGKDK